MAGSGLSKAKTIPLPDPPLTHMSPRFELFNPMVEDLIVCSCS